MLSIFFGASLTPVLKSTGFLKHITAESVQLELCKTPTMCSRSGLSQQYETLTGNKLHVTKIRVHTEKLSSDFYLNETRTKFICVCLRSHFKIYPPRRIKQ